MDGYDHIDKESQEFKEAWAQMEEVFYTNPSDVEEAETAYKKWINMTTPPSLTVKQFNFHWVARNQFPDNVYQIVEGDKLIMELVMFVPFAVIVDVIESGNVEGYEDQIIEFHQYKKEFNISDEKVQEMATYGTFIFNVGAYGQSFSVIDGVMTANVYMVKKSDRDDDDVFATDPTPSLSLDMV